MNPVTFSDAAGPTGAQDFGARLRRPANASSSTPPPPPKIQPLASKLETLTTLLHSNRRVWAGSIDAARMAGMIPATQDAAATTAVAPRTILGSRLVIS